MLKPTRVELAADGFRVILSSQSSEEWAGLAYRSDGWPLCPRCGEDELASVLSLSGRLTLAGAKLLEARQACEEEFLLEVGLRPGATLSSDQVKELRRRLADAGIRKAKPTDEMICYACRWNGGVPRREEAEAWGKLGR